MKRLALLAVAVTIVFPATLAAHHGWGSYNANTLLKIQAPILAVKYESPHGELIMEHQNKKWTITLAPPFRMQNRGLPPESLKVGKVVIAEGYPSRVTPNDMRAERITVDGKTTELR